MRKFLICSLLGLIQSAAVHSTIYEAINSERLIECTFSSTHQNRISVVGLGVQKVIHPEGEVQFTLEETSGQVFVYAMVEHPKVTTVSLILVDGTVQDLECSFKKQPSEILVLNHCLEIACNEAICSSQEGEGESVIPPIIQEIMEGRVNAEYVASDPPVANRKLIARGIFAELTGKLVGPEDIIYVWTIRNKGMSTACLSEKAFFHMAALIGCIWTSIL